MNPEQSLPTPKPEAQVIEMPRHGWNNEPQPLTPAEVQAGLTPEQRAINHDGLARAKAKLAAMQAARRD